MNNVPGRVGDPLPPAPATFHEFWHDWITRGWFEWESEGYPYWSNMRHVQTWWNFRHLPNMLLVHYNDLLKDLPGEIRRIADFLEIKMPPDSLATIADLVTFSSMKKNADLILPEASNVWIGGAQTFIHKGTNGRWRERRRSDSLLQCPICYNLFTVVR
jgi:aryl sulfotransferase